MDGKQKKIFKSIECKKKFEIKNVYDLNNYLRSTEKRFSHWPRLAPRTGQYW